MQSDKNFGELFSGAWGAMISVGAAPSVDLNTYDRLKNNYDEKKTFEDIKIFYTQEISADESVAALNKYLYATALMKLLMCSSHEFDNKRLEILSTAIEQATAILNPVKFPRCEGRLHFENAKEQFINLNDKVSEVVKQQLQRTITLPTSSTLLRR